MKQFLTNHVRSAHREVYFLAVLVLMVGIVLPVFNIGRSSALTLTDRSMSLSSNVTSAGSTVYSFSATVPTGGGTTLGSIEVDICSGASGPLLGTACAAPTGFGFTSSTLTGMSPSGGTPTLGGALTGQTPDSNLGSGSTAARIRISYATPQTVTPGSTVVSFNITAITNPSTAGTFFARIGFFSNNNYTGYTDGGAVANSVQALQNVSFKVQETLAFCVGAMPNATVAHAPATFSTTSLTNNCAQSGGTNIALGIAPDSSTACITPAAVKTPTCEDAATTDDNHYGYAMVQTNASNGATIGYRPNNAGSYTQGTLQTSGTTGCTFTSRIDECINPVNEDQAVAVGGVAAFPATTGTEVFGMAVPSINAQGRGTAALTRNTSSTGYGFTGNVSGGVSCTTGAASTQDCWNWHRTGVATLASSTSAIDNEAIQIFFATKASITTPSGQYAVNVDYFSVPTY